MSYPPASAAGAGGDYGQGSERMGSYGQPQASAPGQFASSRAPGAAYPPPAAGAAGAGGGEPSIADEIAALRKEVASLRIGQENAHAAAKFSQAVPNTTYASQVMEGERIPAGERVTMNVGTVSVVELVPRQAKVPRSSSSTVGRPVVKSTPVSKGPLAGLFGKKVRRVTGYTDVYKVENTGVSERHMVLYQPVIAPGRRRAVCIGINYVGSPKASDRLEHSCNDARYIRQWLQKQQFTDILTLVDDDPSAIYPSRENILKACKWLVYGAHMGDNMFLFYSGHGDWKLDFSGDEDDEHDECLVPADYHELAHPLDAKGGYIIDDELYMMMVAPLPKGAMLHGVFDSCHSGSILDLPYTHNARGACARSGEAIGVHSGVFGLEADVITLTAAKDFQQTPDKSKFASVRMGLLTYAFLVVLEEAGSPANLTYLELLQKIQTQITAAYPPALLNDRAIPMLSSSKPYNLEHPMVI